MYATTKLSIYLLPLNRNQLTNNQYNMGLINEEKVKKAASNVFGEITNGFEQISFQHGVDFAETELKELAIRFAEWSGMNHHLTKHPTEPEIWTNYTETYTTTELFTKFQEQLKTEKI